MRAELVNCDIDYNDKLEGKNIHPKLLPEVVEMMSTESVELLGKSGVTSALKKAVIQRLYRRASELLSRRNHRLTVGVC